MNQNSEVRAVPFYSQKVNWAGEDSGFPGPTEVERWQSNACGIACARMVIGYFTGQRIGYWDLLQKGLARNAYNDVGWIHRGLVDLVGEYGVEGRAHRQKTVEDVHQSLLQGRLCIASVTVGFWGGTPKGTTGQLWGKGGHLVVAVDPWEGGLLVHHPSSLDEGNKPFWPVPWDRWLSSFSGNYMEFWGSATLEGTEG